MPEAPLPLESRIFVVLFLLLFSSSALAFKGTNGYTSADCLSARQRGLCKKSRVCYDTRSYLIGSPTACDDSSSTSCKCFPPDADDLVTCRSSRECVRWERCVYSDLGSKGSDTANKICMSCYYNDVKVFEDAGRRKVENVDNTPAQCSRHPYGGHGGGGDNGNGDGSSLGVSRPPEISPTPSFVNPPSITPRPAGASDDSSDSGGDSPPCFDAKLLENSSHKPVYRTHRTASVLCDALGTCATPGHIVVFRGRSLMMVNYCKVAVGSCSKRNMKVNSPQFGAKVRVKTLTKNLEMTSLSAKYESSAEEFVMKALIRLGA